MTTPRIEEMVEEFKNALPQFLEFEDALDIKFAESSTARKDLIEMVTKALTKAHQAGYNDALKEAVRVIEEKEEPLPAITMTAKEAVAFNKGIITAIQKINELYEGEK